MEYLRMQNGISYSSLLPQTTKDLLLYILFHSVLAFYTDQLLTISQLTAFHPVHLGGLFYFQGLIPERNNSYLY